MSFINEQLRANFAMELDYLEKLPHIIETEDYIFAHAGITTENLEKNEINKVIKRDAFMMKNWFFQNML